MFDSPGRLALGLLTGFVFGFLLQKGQVGKYRVLMGQFLLKDWTVAKIMLVAVAVGSVGVYGLAQAGAVALEVKPAAFGAVLIGGVIFGVGLSILGLCPGTTVAASGEGQRDAMVGVAGMLTGAVLYVVAHGPLTQAGEALGSWGKVTLPTVTATSPWPWVVALCLAAGVAFAMSRSARPASV